MLNEIKKEIIELSLGSTAYGIPNLFRKKRFFNRILWIIFLLVSSVATFFWIHDGIIDYLNYEVVTVVETIYEQPSVFPTVTFCPSSKNDFNDKNLSDLVKGSRFGYDTNISADPGNHFEEFFSQQYGKCFRFNSERNMTNHTISKKYSTIGGRNSYFWLTLNYGLLLWIHNKSSPPNIQSFNNHDDPLLIDKGSFNYLAIDRTIETKLPRPYSQCYDDPMTFEGNKTIIIYILSLNESYSQIKCLELCFDVYYIQNDPCDCNYTKLGSVWLDCWIQKEQNNETSCTYNAKSNFYQNKLVEYCRNYCPLECYSITFSYILSSNKTDKTTDVQIFYRSLK